MNSKNNSEDLSFVTETIGSGSYAYTQLRFPALGGTSVRRYSLFPGVELTINRMYSSSMAMHPEERPDFLIINYGLKGRSEQTLTDGNVTFVAAGELAISAHGVQKSFYFPGGMYEGVELYIDLKKVRADRSGLLRSLGLVLDGLSDLYGKNGFFKSGHLPEVDVIMKRIFETKGDGSAAEWSLLCVSTLEFFRILLYEKIPETEYANLSPENVAFARAYRNALTENLSERISAKEAARKFQISETSLKNYFRIVYGENVSAYMKRYRMKKAAQLLSSTKETIGQISEEVGFQGQNKFSAAFRSFSGMSPSEYRRRHYSSENARRSEEPSPL